MKVTSDLKVSNRVLWENLPRNTVIKSSISGNHWIVVASKNENYKENLIYGIEEGFLTCGSSRNESYIDGVVLPAGTKIELVVE